MVKQISKIPKDYSLIKDIRAQKLYKANVQRRDKESRKILEEKCEQTKDSDAFKGQMCLFQYFEPKYKDELEYYDASPCAIIFGKVKNKEGEWRILGWNQHYYPPRVRFILANRIFEIFKPYYAQKWNEPLSKEISFMDYKFIMDQLKKHKLDFGVRMYIPELITKIRPIPLEYWHMAVFTEGWFKKRTREAIMKYWTNFISKFK